MPGRIRRNRAPYDAREAAGEEMDSRPTRSMAATLDAFVMSVSRPTSRELDPADGSVHGDGPIMP